MFVRIQACNWFLCFFVLFFLFSSSRRTNLWKRKPETSQFLTFTVVQHKLSTVFLTPTFHLWPMLFLLCFHVTPCNPFFWDNSVLILVLLVFLRSFFQSRSWSPLPTIKIILASCFPRQALFESTNDDKNPPPPPPSATCTTVCRFSCVGF